MSTPDTTTHLPPADPHGCYEFVAGEPRQMDDQYAHQRWFGLSLDAVYGYRDADSGTMAVHIDARVRGLGVVADFQVTPEQLDRMIDNLVSLRHDHLVHAKRPEVMHFAGTGRG